MIQEILMWISVVSAFGYAAYSLGKTIWESYQESQPGCSGSCGSCSAKKDLLKQSKLKHFKPVKVAVPKR